MDSYGVLDVEVDGDPWSGRLLCLGWRGKAYQEPIPFPVLDQLEAEEITKVVFTRFDHRWLKIAGFKVGGPIHDVQTMAWCVDERTPLDLKFVAHYYCGIAMDKRISKDGKTFRCDDGTLVPLGEAPIKQVMAYNVRDLEATEAAYIELLRTLRQTGQYDYWQKMHVPFTPVLVGMEVRGLPIDVFRTKAAAFELRGETKGQEATLKADGGLPGAFNLASGPQMMGYLFSKSFDFQERIGPLPKEDIREVKVTGASPALPGGFVVEKVGRLYVTGYTPVAGRGLKALVKAPKCAEEACGHGPGECLPSVATKVLKVYHGDDPWIEKLVDYRVLVKALQFLDTWIEVNHEGRVYARFNQTGTATGRLSSSDPNLQNVPGRGALGRRIRGLFRPRRGKVFVHGDYDQIEPRLMAHFSGDACMIEAFEQGEDIYAQASETVLGRRYEKGTPERFLVRTCFLAMGYGAQPKKIRANLAEEGFRFPLSTIKEVYGDITDLYCTFWAWKDEAIAEAEDLGYVETIGGHRRHIAFTDDTRWKSERQAVNSKIQGSAADIVQGAMIAIYETIPEVELLLQVHDELLGEVDEARSLGGIRGQQILRRFRKAAEVDHGFGLAVPLVFEPKFVKSWAEGKD